MWATHRLLSGENLFFKRAASRGQWQPLLEQQVLERIRKQAQQQEVASVQAARSALCDSHFTFPTSRFSFGCQHLCFRSAHSETPLRGVMLFAQPSQGFKERVAEAMAAPHGSKPPSSGWLATHPAWVQWVSALESVALEDDADPARIDSGIEVLRSLGFSASRPVRYTVLLFFPGPLFPWFVPLLRSTGGPPPSSRAAASSLGSVAGGVPAVCTSAAAALSSPSVKRQSVRVSERLSVCVCPRVRPGRLGHVRPHRHGPLDLP